MQTRLNNRSIVFFVQDNHLVRIVAGTQADDRTYTHRCPRLAFETVAYAIAETPREGDGTSLEQIARQEQLPFTQVNVALEFLKERGIVEVRHRRSYPGTRCVFEDALIEFLVLAHGDTFV